MLSFLCFLSKASLCRPTSALTHLLKLQSSQKYISTNTAINKSLRRSQYQVHRPVRSPSRDERTSQGSFKRESPHVRIRKPNHQLGIDVEDVEEFTRRNESDRELNRTRLTRRRIKRDEPGSALERPPRESPYNYDPKPEGNRAARRAKKFGKHLKEPVLDGSNKTILRALVHRKSANERTTSYAQPARERYGSRRPAEREQDRNDSHGFSIPRHLQDDLQSFPEPQKISFTMGRRDGTLNSDMPASSVSEPHYGPTHSRPFDGQERDRLRSNDRSSSHREFNVPLSIPYTTPASEFLYGTSVVISALTGSSRKFYKLYMYDGDNRDARNQDKRIRSLALDRNVVVERVQGGWLRLMDKMSMGRPHNGYILEASPLRQLPVIGFRSVERPQGGFHVLLDHQSREDEAINGTDTLIECETGFPRYPLVLLLDGILDPGNLGAILRSAFFLGVDAVAISKRSSAPLSPVALKASAGASENLPIVSVNKPMKFIETCRNYGWKICAAVSPESAKLSGAGRYISTTTTLQTPVQEHPCVLILGGEGEGLRLNIQSKADFKIGIEGQRAGQGGVDSLNVSVATGLLCEAFLRKPAMSEKITANFTVDSATDVSTASHDGGMEGGNRLF